MAAIKSEDGTKWINAFVAIISLLLTYVSIQFFELLGEWFDLEAKVPHFVFVIQGLAVALGIACFVLIKTNANASTHMQEVYAELTKVIWPDRDTVVKVTIGIVIGLSIVSSIFVGIDFIFQKGLDFIY